MAGDLLIQHALNTGLPLSGVVDTRVLADALAEDPARFLGSVLVSPVPEAESRWAEALEAHLQAGGRLLLYGPAALAGKRWSGRIRPGTAGVWPGCAARPP